MSFSKVSDGISISNNKDVHAPDFEAVAWDIHNRATCHVRTAAIEVLCFRKFFGTSAHVVMILWELLLKDNLLPEGGCPKHLL